MELDRGVREPVGIDGVLRVLEDAQLVSHVAGGERGVRHLHEAAATSDRLRFPRLVVLGTAHEEAALGRRRVEA